MSREAKPGQEQRFAEEIRKKWPKAVTESYDGRISVKVRINRSKLLRRVLTIHTSKSHSEWLLYAYLFWCGRLDLDFVSASGTGTVFRGRLPENGDQYYFKKIRTKSVVGTAKHILRPLPAVRAYRATELLSAADLETPPILAVIEYHENGLPVASGLITEAVYDAEPLDEFFKKGDFYSYPVATRYRILRKIGTTAGRLHKAGLVHGDLRLGNLLGRMKGESGELEIVFIDNERTRRCMRQHERARNLVQLNILWPELISPRDRLRCWRAYRQAREMDPKAARRLFREAEKWSQRHWQSRGWI